MLGEYGVARYTQFRQKLVEFGLKRWPAFSHQHDDDLNVIGCREMQVRGAGHDAKIGPSFSFMRIETIAELSTTSVKSGSPSAS